MAGAERTGRRVGRAGSSVGRDKDSNSSLNEMKASGVTENTGAVM